MLLDELPPRLDLVPHQRLEELARLEGVPSAGPSVELIDRNLRLAGWNVTDTSQVIQELDIELAKAGYPPVLYRLLCE